MGDDKHNSLDEPLQLKAIDGLLRGSFDGLIDLLEDCMWGRSTPSTHVIDLLRRFENRDPHLNYWLLDNKGKRPKRPAGRPQKDAALDDYITDWLVVYVRALKFEQFEKSGKIITTDQALDLLSEHWPIPSERTKRYELLRRSEDQKQRVW